MRCDKNPVLKIIRTSIILISMSNAGINIGIYSPTLPDIEELTNSTTSEVSTTQLWVGLSGVLGALILGALFDRCRDGLPLLAVSLFLQGLLLGVAPLPRNLIAYEILFVSAMFFNFGITAGCLSLNCAIWKDVPWLVGPIVQATDLIHVAGTALTPLIVQPFLGQGNSSLNSGENITKLTSNLSSGMVKQLNKYDLLGNSDRFKASELLPIEVAYIIIAGLDIACALLCLMVYIVSRCSATYNNLIGCPAKYDVISKSSDSSTINLNIETHDSPRLRHRLSRSGSDDSANIQLANSSLLNENSKHKLSFQRTLNSTVTASNLLILTIIFLFFLVNGGRDGLLTGLLYTFTYEYLSYSVEFSARLVSAYQLTRVLVHIIVVIAAGKLSPSKLTAVNIFVLICSSLAMLAFLHAGYAFTGVAVIVMGFATSNIHPTAMTLVGSNFDISEGRVMGFLLAAMAVGQGLFATLTGALLQKIGVISFPLVLLFLSIIGCLLWVIWEISVRKLKNKHRVIYKNIN